MLSSDKNVENIAQLIEVLKHYLGLQTEYVKLDAIDKVVRLVTAARVHSGDLCGIDIPVVCLSFLAGYVYRHCPSLPYHRYTLSVAAHTLFLLPQALDRETSG